MTLLLLGLILFLGIHSIRIVADDARRVLMARIGAPTWKALYSMIALIGFGLLIVGFGQARQQPVLLWSAPTALRHLAALLTAIAFILLAAAYVPGNGIKARLHHPMLIGVKLWAFAHLLANGRLADVILFGSFLAWAIWCFRAARRRDRAAGTVYPAGRSVGSVATVVIGLAAWGVFAFWLHARLIGVSPIAV